MEKLKDYLETDELRRQKNWESVKSFLKTRDFYERFSDGLLELLKILKEEQHGIKVVYTKSIQRLLNNTMNPEHYNIDSATADKFMVEYFIPEASKHGIEIWAQGSYCFLTKNYHKFDEISIKFWTFMNKFSNLRENECNVIKVLEPLYKITDLKEGNWYRCVHGRNSQNMRYTINKEEGGLYAPGNGKLNEDEYANCLFQEI